MDPDSKRLRVSVTDWRGRPVRDGGLARWLEAVAPADARGDVAVALAGDAHVRTLNRRYRRKDRATDVLAFPAGPISGRSRRPPVPRARNRVDVVEPRPFDKLRVVPSFVEGRAPNPDPSTSSGSSRASSRDEPRFLGDIVIATGVARRQARDAGHSEQAELRVLALHGLLHLLGYDHHGADAGARMARVEARLRRKGGLTSGLIERAGAPRRPS